MDESVNMEFTLLMQRATSTWGDERAEMIRSEVEKIAEAVARLHAVDTRTVI